MGRWLRGRQVAGLLVIVGIVVAIALVFTGPVTEAVFPYGPEPCQSPAFGPPGGCLLPAR